MHEVGMPVALWDAQDSELCRERDDPGSRLFILAGSRRKRGRRGAFDEIGSSRRGRPAAGLVMLTSGAGVPRPCAGLMHCHRWRPDCTFEG
jgi:hypothetical protein